MSSEREIKAIVLDRLLKSGKIGADSLVFSEMSLAGKVRRIDLGYILKKEMVAIEIKTEKDTLLRLSGQLEEYRKYFDRVVVVVAPKFVEGVIAVADPDVEIWKVSCGEVVVVRKGRLIKLITKESYLSLMTKREVALLARKIGVMPGELPMYDLKVEVLSKLSKISKNKVKDVLLEGLFKRFGMASNRFLKKVDSLGRVSVSDVPLLSPHISGGLEGVNPPTLRQY
jgi:hypothetical protein